MNFSKDNTKLMFAAVKLIFVLVIGLIYAAGGKSAFRSLLGLEKAEENKSILLFLCLSVLTIFRDKHEKKIITTYDPSKLHFGRALLTPLVYLSFTVMMILEQSIVSLVVASIYQIGFFYFYFDDAQELFSLGVNKE
jgi:hypothetical protein